MSGVDDFPGRRRRVGVTGACPPLPLPVPLPVRGTGVERDGVPPPLPALP